MIEFLPINGYFKALKFFTCNSFISNRICLGSSWWISTDKCLRSHASKQATNSDRLFDHDRYLRWNLNFGNLNKYFFNSSVDSRILAWMAAYKIFLWPGSLQLSVAYNGTSMNMMNLQQAVCTLTCCVAASNAKSIRINFYDNKATIRLQKIVH